MSQSNACPFCAEEVEEGSSQCPHCESFLNKESGGQGIRFCPSCKEEVKGGAKKCPECGSNIFYHKNKGKIYLGVTMALLLGISWLLIGKPEATKEETRNLYITPSGKTESEAPKQAIQETQSGDSSSGSSSGYSGRPTGSGSIWLKIDQGGFAIETDIKVTLRGQDNGFEREFSDHCEHSYCDKADFSSVEYGMYDMDIEYTTKNELGRGAVGYRVTLRNINHECSMTQVYLYSGGTTNVSCY